MVWCWWFLHWLLQMINYYYYYYCNLFTGECFWAKNLIIELLFVSFEHLVGHFFEEKQIEFLNCSMVATLYMCRREMFVYTIYIDNFLINIFFKPHTHIFLSRNGVIFSICLSYNMRIKSTAGVSHIYTNTIISKCEHDLKYFQFNRNKP